MDNSNAALLLSSNQDHLYINTSYNISQLHLNPIRQNSEIYDTFNTNSEYLFNSPYLTIIVGIIAMCMSFITIVGNVLVITAFIIDKNLRKYSNYFILNLSLADLLIGLLIPPYAPFLLYNYNWKLGRIACTVWLVLDYVVGSASVLCIVVISLDRYWMVSRGLKYISNQKISRAIFIMLTVWIIAFLNYAPAIIFWEILLDDNFENKTLAENGENICQVGFHDNLVYLTATACVEFFLPFISICSLNLAVYLNIRKRSKGLIRTKTNNKKSETPFLIKCSQKSTKKASTRTQDSNENDDLETSNKPIVKILENENISKSITLNNCPPPSTPLNYSAIDTTDTQLVPINCTKKISQNSDDILKNQKDSRANSETLPLNVSWKNFEQRKPNGNEGVVIKKDKNLTKDKKAARSLFILVFTFVFCWAPYTFLTLIKSVCNNCVKDSVYEITFWLLWFNSTLNPILYPFLHVQFRKAFSKIFNRLFCCFGMKKNRNGVYNLPATRKTNPNKY